MGNQLTTTAPLHATLTTTVDPRSPTTAFRRTPLKAAQDPRSPSLAFARTPLRELFGGDPRSPAFGFRRSPITAKTVDPRSPRVARTPLALTFAANEALSPVNEALSPVNEALSPVNEALSPDASPAPVRRTRVRRRLALGGEDDFMSVIDDVDSASETETFDDADHAAFQAALEFDWAIVSVAFEEDEADDDDAEDEVAEADFTTAPSTPVKSRTTTLAFSTPQPKAVRRHLLNGGKASSPKIATMRHMALRASPVARHTMSCPSSPAA